MYIINSLGNSSGFCFGCLRPSRFPSKRFKGSRLGLKVYGVVKVWGWGAGMVNA